MKEKELKTTAKTLVMMAAWSGRRSKGRTTRRKPKNSLQEYAYWLAHL
jgi:hypothetical protein